MIYSNYKLVKQGRLGEGEADSGIAKGLAALTASEPPVETDSPDTALAAHIGE